MENNIKSSKKRRIITLDEKIKIFEEFFEKNENLTGSTVYKGYPIGEWSVQIRSWIKRKELGKGKQIKYTEEQLKKLSELGILEGREFYRIDEKINFLIEWVKKYPKARPEKMSSEYLVKEYAKNDEEYEKLCKEYKQINKYYEYLRIRNTHHAIKPEQFEKCKNGDVGGVFGFSDKTIEKYQKLGLNKQEMVYIILNFGSIENLVDDFKNGKIKGSNSFIQQFFDVDMSENKGYYKLIEKIVPNIPNGKILFFSSERLKEAIEMLDDKQRKIIEENFGLKNGTSPKSLLQIGKEINVSKQRASQVEKDALNKLSKAKMKKEFLFDIKKILGNKYITPQEKSIIENAIDKIYEDFLLIDKNGIKKNEESEIIKLFDFLKKKNKLFRIRKGKQNINEAIGVKCKDEFKQENETKFIRAENISSFVIEDLNLSTRTFNTLKRNNINNLGDLFKLNDLSLQKLNKLGISSYNEIVDKLKHIGIDFTQNCYIEQLDLSINSYQCLKNSNIITTGQLSLMSPFQISSINNVGFEEFEEIMKKRSENLVVISEANRQITSKEYEKIEKNLVEHDSKGKKDLEELKKERDEIVEYLKKLKLKTKETKILLEQYNKFIKNVKKKKDGKVEIKIEDSLD